MQNHTKVYLKHFVLDQGDRIVSELSCLNGADIHHISARGSGGSKKKDYIENLICLTREEHMRCEMSVLCNKFIHMVHAKFLELGYYSYPEKENYFLTTFFKPNLLAFNFIWENMDNLEIVNNYLKDNGYEEISY